MSRRLAVVAVVIGAVVLVAIARKSNEYTVTMDLPQTGGARVGSDVRVAGASVGRVADMQLGKDDLVHVKLALKPDKVVIGRGASVEIKGANLLGEKFLQIDPGDARHPEPSGYHMSADRVSFPTDLDQVLDVLDTDTRVRLRILLNEVGLGVANRTSDLGQALEKAGPSFEDLGTVVNAVGSDNRELGRLVDRTDGWVAAFARERKPLGDTVEAASQTMATLVTKQRELSSTLETAPGTLASARTFLADLRSTTVPLEPAARAIAQVAPPLTQTLRQVKPFEAAAKPTLESATEAAPLLSRLAVQATPPVRRAVPALQSVAELARSMPEVSRTLDEGIDGILSTVQGWSRAIQTRDAAGHVFRGNIGLGPEFVNFTVNRLAQSMQPVKRKSAEKSANPADKPSAPETSSAGSAPKPQGAAPSGEQPPALKLPGIPDLPQTITDITGKLAAPSGEPAPPKQDPAGSLLDYLLGS